MQGDDNQSDSEYSDDSSSLSSHNSERDEDEEDENIGPLHEAAAKNDMQQLIKLISLPHSQENPIDINVRYEDFYNLTPLHLAAENNVGSSHYDLVEVLLKNGADPNVGDLDNRTPLFYVVENCNLEMLKLFLRFKADFTHENIWKSPLISSATKNFNNLDVLQFIVQDIGLDINHKNNSGSTPLHEAARYNKIDSHYRMLEFLLENGADVNARDVHGLTPLWYLVNNGNWKIVELFLKHNADVYFVGKKGKNILFQRMDDVQVLEKLLKEYPDLNVNHTAELKRTPLHYIANWLNDRLMKLEVIKCFLKNGANVNAPDEFGLTPLILTVREIREKDEKWFLENIDCFNFLIDQTDFSVARKNANIFDYYFYRIEEDVNALIRPEHLQQWILEHLAKLKFLSIEIHPILLEIINNQTDSKDYFSKCTQELEAMNNKKPQNCWITYFNLLVDSRKKLKNYAGNKDLIEDYKKNDWLEMFPIYGASIKKSVKKGLMRRELFNKSSILLSDCLPVFNCTHLIIKDILDCVMSKKDLSKFCKCRFLLN